MPPILIAIATVEFRMRRVRVAIGNLRESSGLERRIAEAARHRVIPIHAQSGRRATLEGQLQAAVVLNSEIAVKVQISDERRSSRVLTGPREHSSSVDIPRVAAGGIGDALERAR